jgi:predicted acetyltransferase
MTPTQVAFGEPVSGPAVDDWAKLVEVDRWLGAFESPQSDVPVGAAAALSVKLTVPGGEVPAAAVTAVGVRPDHRRRGALGALMRRQLDDVRAGAEPVAILWASEGAIYQRFGYGLATFDGSLEVTAARTAFTREPESQGRVRLVTEEESRTLVPAIYESMRVSTSGAISRSDGWWTVGVLADPEYSREGMSEKYRVVYEVDGHAEGYAIYRLKPDWDSAGPKAELVVREAVTTTPRALRAIWRYLFDMDLVRTVKATRMAVPNPLQHVLAEPRAMRLSVADGIWARLVDLPAALGARRYATSDALVLEVSDAFCPWNAGRWRISTSGPRDAAVAVVEATDDAAELALDTTDLAAAYLGGKRLLDLAAADRVTELRAGAVVRADALFSAGREPWCISMF